MHAGFYHVTIVLYTYALSSTLMLLPTELLELMSRRVALCTFAGIITGITAINLRNDINEQKPDLYHHIAEDLCQHSAMPLSPQGSCKCSDKKWMCSRTS